MDNARTASVVDVGATFHRALSIMDKINLAWVALKGKLHSNEQKEFNMDLDIVYKYSYLANMNDKLPFYTSAVIDYRFFLDSSVTEKFEPIINTIRFTFKPASMKRLIKKSIFSGVALKEVNKLDRFTQKLIGGTGHRLILSGIRYQLVMHHPDLAEMTKAHASIRADKTHYRDLLRLPWDICIINTVTPEKGYHHAYRSYAKSHRCACSDTTPA